jgi:hypothetical protein
LTSLNSTDNSQAISCPLELVIAQTLRDFLLKQNALMVMPMEFLALGAEFQVFKRHLGSFASGSNNSDFHYRLFFTFG